MITIMIELLIGERICGIMIMMVDMPIDDIVFGIEKDVGVGIKKEIRGR